MPAGWTLQPDENDILIRRWAAMRDFVVTAGDTEVTAYEPGYRAAAATARAMLCQAAADRWGAAVEETDTRDGFVVWGNEKLRFAELAEEAVGYPVPSPAPLRTTLPGNVRAEPIGDAPPFARLDLPAKVDGSATFAGDVRLPDMVYAAIRQGPVGAVRLESVSRKPADGVTGLIDVVQGEGWVAAVATSWWGADKAVRLLRPRFAHIGGRLSGDQIAERLDKALDGPDKGGRTGYRMFARGEEDSGFASAKGLAARYSIAARRMPRWRPAPSPRALPTTGSNSGSRARRRRSRAAAPLMRSAFRRPMCRSIRCLRADRSTAGSTTIWWRLRPSSPAICAARCS